MLGESNKYNRLYLIKMYTSSATKILNSIYIYINTRKTPTNACFASNSAVRVCERPIGSITGNRLRAPYKNKINTNLRVLFGGLTGFSFQ